MRLTNISETSISNVMNYANGHCINTPATDLRDQSAFNLPKPIIDNPHGFLKRTHSKGYYIISVLLERVRVLLFIMVMSVDLCFGTSVSACSILNNCSLHGNGSCDNERDFTSYKSLNF